MAAKCKDKSQITAKKHHDKHKSFLPQLSPGQFVTMQDPQSGNWRENGHVNQNNLYVHAVCFDLLNHKLLTRNIPPSPLLFHQLDKIPPRPLCSQLSLVLLNLLQFLFADHNKFVIWIFRWQVILLCAWGRPQTKQKFVVLIFIIQNLVENVHIKKKTQSTLPTS